MRALLISRTRRAVSERSYVCVLREVELELGLNEGVRLSRLEKDRDGGVASWVIDTAVAESTYVVYECYV